MESIESENSASIRKNHKLLTKISLTDIEKVEINKNKHICDILLLNNLELFNKNQEINQDLFSSISECLYYTDTYADKLKNECKNFQKTCQEKNDIPDKIKWILKEKSQIDHYIADQENPTFEALNQELLSYINKVKISQYSVQTDNSVLFGSIFNTKFTNEVSLCATAEDGKLKYSAVFEKDFNQENKKKLLNQNMENMENNLNYATKSDVDFKSFFCDIKLNTKAMDENMKKYEELIGRYLNTVSHIESNWQNLKNNEKKTNSAQKELSNVYHQYARSVSKSSVISRKKFFFTEEVTFENLDAQSKKEIIFGEQCEDYYLNNPPPGLEPVELKILKVSNQDRQKSSNNTSDNYTPNTITPQKNQVSKNYNFEEKLQKEDYKDSINSVKEINLDKNNETTTTRNKTSLHERDTEQKINMDTQKNLKEKDRNKTPKRNLPVILDNDMKKSTGRQKFFEPNKNYGFIVSAEEGCDVFVHFEELKKAGISLNTQKNQSLAKTIKLRFCAQTYIDKNSKLSKKAIEIEFIDMDESIIN